MNDDKRLPLVVDAEYYVVDSKKGWVSKDIKLGGVTISDKHQRTFRDAVTYVVKSGFYFLLWIVRQFGSLMIDGISGTVSGIKEASEYESRYDLKNNKKRSRPVSHVREKRPMWQIPTREEEEAERNSRYRYE